MTLGDQSKACQFGQVSNLLGELSYSLEEDLFRSLNGRHCAIVCPLQLSVPIQVLKQGVLCDRFMLCLSLLLGADNGPNRWSTGLEVSEPIPQAWK